MKFSYKLLKKYLPEISSQKDVADYLNKYVFEIDGLENDTLDVSIPSNRYSTGASHIGLAKEIKAAMNLKKTDWPEFDIKEWEGESDEFSIDIQNKDLCPRYTGWYFDNVKIEESPDWIKEILIDCGLRPINNIVDIMNYVMLETGQPLHAFDYDKVVGHKIIVRNAKEGEKMTSIDGVLYKLDSSVLVVADEEKPLAIAGIKGGKDAEVTAETKRIIVEAANFDFISIHKASRTINLTTDASLRFSHDLHKRLALEGLERAGQLLKEIVGAVPGGKLNSNSKVESKKRIVFNFSSFNNLMGLDLSDDEIKNILERFGFEVGDNIVFVPSVRDDLNTQEDLIEEISRIVGFDDIEAEAPSVKIKPSVSDDIYILKNQIREILTGFGFDEVYNYSFLGDENYGGMELENPISEDRKFLRSTLENLIFDNVKENLKHFDKVRLFEIGKVFGKSEERNVLGLGISLGNKTGFFELKGVIEGLLKRLGIMDFYMKEIEGDNGVSVVVDDLDLGHIKEVGNLSFCELRLDDLLKLVRDEVSYRGLPKHPAVLRDISVLINDQVRIGNLIKEIQEIDLELIEDVDLVDEYFGKDDGKQSITLRIRFRSEEKTLSSDDVDVLMKKITDLLKNKFKCQIN